MQALSVVAPNGSRILNGEKTLEVRKWRPDDELRNLIIVENRNYLSETYTKETGTALCLVDIVDFHPWEEHELATACGQYWEPGWIAWEIENVRPLKQFPTTAQRRIYDLDVDNSFCV